MNFYFSKLWKARAVAAFGCASLVVLSTSAGAQTPPPPLMRPQTTPKSPPLPVTLEQARTHMRLVLASNVLQSSITLSVKNTSLEDIAAQVQKALVESHSTAKIDIRVRQAHSVRLSFAVKDLTVDAILRSSGDLASVQLWGFSDYLLLAPFEALSADEKKALEVGTAFKAPMSSGDRREIIKAQQKALCSFIIQEMKGLSAGKEANAGSNKITLDQLSPESQQMLQMLCANAKEKLTEPNSRIPVHVINAISALNPSNADSVELVPGNPFSVQLNFSGKAAKGEMSWSASGESGMSIDISDDSGSATPPTPPLLDPSAKNS